jgi:chemotaxis protein CheZ
MKEKEVESQMDDQLKKTTKDIAHLSHYFIQLRKEVARLYLRKDVDMRFTDVVSQLESVLNSTEEATHDILRALEAINEEAFSLDSTIKAGQSVSPQLVESIRAHAIKGIEACVFQDVTGQRINKIMRSLRYAESTVERLVDHAGRDEVEKIVEEIQTEENKDTQESRGFNQSDIDNLFS